MRLKGLYVQFSTQLDPQANARIHGLCERLLAHPLRGVSDLYPGYINLYIEFDETLVQRGRVGAWVRHHLQGLQPQPAGRLVEVPVCYDGEDLPWIAQQTGLSVEEVIELHAGQEYRVYTVGFVPGQPMLGTLDPRLYLPRRSSPRKRVPAHTLAMAVNQTTIYSLSTPGGWHWLGKSLEAVYDPHRANPFLLQAGERVRFVRARGSTPPEPSPLEMLPPEPRFPVLRVEEPGLLDVLLDQGRFMAARFGMARSGPMDAHSARLASSVVGNGPDLPLLELTLKGPVLRVLRDTALGFAGFGMQALLDGEAIPPARSVAVRAGQRISFKSTARGVRAYLAVAGGLEAQAFMGSQSTDLQGLIGRALRAGDVLGLAKPRRVLPGFSLRGADLSETVAIRLEAGPQATPEALAALGSGLFSVTSPNRMGVQLEGPKVPGGELISEASPMGSVQITPAGNPILLLNDRGRIGGYAKPAIVDPRDLPLVAQLRPGQRIRFIPPASADTAHWFIWV